MANQIVFLNVSEQIAATPNNLQQQGALISQGATTLTAGTYSLLTQLSDLTALLVGGKALASLVYSSGTVTATFSVAHGWTTAETIPVTIAGAVPAAFNGTFSATVATTTTITYTLGVVPSPTSATTPGTATIGDVRELTQMATTFFGQGNTQSVYVLELGEGNAADGIAALGTFITAQSPQQFYAYLVPREWDANSALLTLMATFEALTAKTYFFVTTTTGTYTTYGPLLKCTFAMIEAPGVASSASGLEFSCAGPFYKFLNYAPSATNQLTQMCFSFLFGVTPYPTAGNGALFASIKAAFVNIAQAGSEGGIANATLYWGTMCDGNDASYWYSVDWVQIQEELALANEVINGSNDPLAPLMFNQSGINRLQARAQQVVNSAVSFGLALGPVTVTAISFQVYVTQNPSAYAQGSYTGLAVIYTPLRGFKAITFNVLINNIPTA